MPEKIFLARLQPLPRLRPTRARRRTSWMCSRTSQPSFRVPRQRMANITTPTDGPKLTPLGKAFVFLFIVACVAGAYYMFVGKKALQATRDRATAVLGGGPPVEIGIAYGTEKQRWLEWAVAEFAKTSDGKRIRINLIPMGSLEGAHALISGDQRIQVWSPASSLYKDIFVQEWQVK